MGEPLPGDIPDPIYLKTTNVPLAANQVVTRGAFVERATAPNWSAIATTNVGFINNDVVQSQEDQNSTGLAAGAVNIGAFGSGSWVYALCGQILEVEMPVRLAVYNDTTNRVGFVNTLSGLTIDTSIDSDGAGTATMIITTARGIQIGDQIIVTATTNFNFTYTVTDVSADGLTITMFNAGATNTTAETSGTFAIVVTKATATARFIKVSGDTVVGNSALSDVGVFALGVAS